MATTTYPDEKQEPGFVDGGALDNDGAGSVNTIDALIAEGKREFLDYFPPNTLGS